MTIEAPLPIPGTGGLYSMNWAMQLAEMAIDFHPTDRELPRELGGRLRNQELSIFLRVCAGVGCPPRWAYQEFPPAPQEPIKCPGSDNPATHVPAREEREPMTLPTEELTCYHLDLYAKAHSEVTGPEGAQMVALVIDGIEIVDIKPEGLENGFECYIEAMLQHAVMPRLRILLTVIGFDLPLGLGSVR
ncbi:MAG: hypothetical protein GY926_12235 [bacterium]|nr:hypothetical protein [bacterium]